MKEFNLQEAMSGNSVVTRDGHNVKLIKFDLKSTYSVVGVISYDDEESVNTFTIDGEHDINKRHPFDLFMA